MPAFAENRYDKMVYRRCGRSGLKLPVVSLGFWQSLGEAGGDELCRQACYFAFDHGITHFDLANNYGPPPGNSETLMGQILRDMPRDELVISTKAGWWMWPGPYGDWGSKKYLIASLDQSLRRMKLDYVDIYYHHRPDPETPVEETMAALDQIVRQGKALYVGVSSYNGVQFTQAAQVMKQHDWAPLTIHQPRINLLERGPIADLLPHTQAWGAGAIAFCPLAQGRLSSKYLTGLPTDTRFGRRGAEGKQWYAEQEAMGTWRRVKKLHEIAQRRGQTVAQLALTWLLDDPRITSVLIGASKIEQIQDNLGAVSAAPLSDEERKDIAEAVK